MKPTRPERHVVLVRPEIHWNTGNIGRSCLGAGAFLHLIRPLGFSLDDKKVKRAGLDYWPRVSLQIWDDFDSFCNRLRVLPDEVALFTKSGRTSFWELPAVPRLFLIFGSESRGLPEVLLNTYGASRTYYIPITDHIRSLNLSSAVTAALYESLRHAGPAFHAWP